MELSLTFDAVEETDMGNYTCHVENHNGRGRGSVVLQKKGKTYLNLMLLQFVGILTFMTYILICTSNI